MGDIKTRFALEGESQFRSAMNNAANAIKVLNAEQKLAKASFQQTGDAEKYAATQASILQQKIAQQKAAVQAAEQAIKQLTDNGVSPASRQFQQWQTKLFNAQTALTNMETDLQNVNNTMQRTTTTAEGTGDAIEDIGTKVSFDAVISGIGKITDKMAAAANKAKELALEVANAMRDAASWADDLATTATVYGLSTDEVQRMRYTADILDTSFEAILKSRQKLVNAMQSDSDVFGELGVQIYEMGMSGKFGEVQGDLRNWEDVFWDLGAALTNIEKTKGFEYVNKQAQQLLGRNWEQLKPIFNSDWASADNYLGRAFNSAREYYEAVMASWNTVGEEDVNKLTKYDDALQRVQNELETLQNTVLSQLAPGFTDIANTVGDLVSQFNQYLQTDKGKEKLQALSDAVTGFFEGLTDVNFGDVLDTAKGALDSLVKGLDWLKENGDTVKGVVEGLAIAFGTLKVSETVLTFMQLLASGKFLLGGGAAAAGGAAAGGAGAGIGGLTAGGVLAGVAKTVPYALPFIIGIAGMINDQKMLAEWAEKGSQAVAEYNMKSQLYAGSEYFDMWDTLTKYGTVNGESGSDAEGIQKFAQHYSEWFNDEVTDPLMDAMVEAFPTYEDYENFHDIMERINNGEMFYSDEDRESLAKAINDAISAVETLMQNDPAIVPVGLDLADGALANLSSQIGTITVPVVLDYGDGTPHANGLWSVPFDGYPAILHKGERVMTAREVQSRSYNSNLYVESMYMNNGVDAAGLASAMAAAQRRTMSGLGS